MTDLASAVRRGSLLAGPAAVLSLLLFFGALAVHGDDARDLTRTALGITSNLLGLVSAGLLLLGLLQLALTSAGLRETGGRTAVFVAGAGTLLLVGGAWTQLVVLPALAADAPRLANEGHGLVTGGYVVSFLVAGLGWLLVALRLRREGAVSRGHVRLLLAGAALMVVPLPVRWFLLAVAVTLLTRSAGDRAAVREPVPAAG